jgi:hypothetical protein
MNWLVTPYVGVWTLVPYFGLCVFLLWKLPKIVLPRAAAIGAVFVVFKVFEPALIRALLGG